MDIKNNQNNQLDTRVIDLHELAKTLWVKKKIIAVVMAIAFIVASTYIMLLVPVYQPSALIQVSSSQNSGMSAFAMASGSGQQEASQDQIEMALIQSPYILRPTIQVLNLDVSIVPHYFPIIGEYIARHYHGEGVASAKLGLSHYAWGGETWALDYFIAPFSKGNYKLVMGEKQSYQLFSPNGRLLLTGHAGEASTSQDGTVGLRWKALNLRPGTDLYLTKYPMVSTLKNLSGGLQVNELSGSGDSGGDTGLVQLSYNSSNPALAAKILNTVVKLIYEDNLNQRSLQSDKTLEFIQKQLPVAKKTLTDAQTQMNLYQAKNGMINFTDHSKLILENFAQVNDQLLQINGMLAQYSQSYTNENPIMQSLMLQADSLQKQKTALQTQLTSLPLKDQQVMNMMLELRVKQQTYSMLLMKEQQSELDKAGTLGDIRVLDLAAVPDEALPVAKVSILLAALLAGFIIGCAIILIWHQFKNMVTDPYWVERELGIRTIGILPFSKEQMLAKKAYDDKVSRRIKILTLSHPEDPCVEAIRSLRTSLFFALKEKKTNVANITGVTPATGKSFIAVNLGVILAQSGKRVVLIDADMRRGYLNRYFGKSHAPGLSELLNGAVGLNEAIHTTDVKGLDFIPTGLYPDHPSELLLRDEFKDMLKVLSENYDLVLIDSPPILAVNDASVIAKEVPVNYLVVPGGQLKPKEIEAAVRRFYNDGVSLTGSLFNFAKQNVEKMSTHTYHSYATYYKKDKEQQDRT